MFYRTKRCYHKRSKIGNNCFVGPNSVLTFNIPDLTAVSGNPAKIIGKVNLDKDKVSITKNKINLNGYIFLKNIAENLLKIRCFEEKLDNLFQKSKNLWNIS